MLTSRKAHIAFLILTPTQLLLQQPARLGSSEWVPNQPLTSFLFCVIVTSGSSELEKVGSIFLQVSFLLIVEDLFWLKIIKPTLGVFKCLIKWMFHWVPCMAQSNMISQGHAHQHTRFQINRIQVLFLKFGCSSSHGTCSKFWWTIQTVPV